MQVSCPTNDVKIYNLSAGKTLPEWISARKRRRLAQRDVEIRQRIELLQDFDMPDVSNCVEVTRDGQYIFAAGIYKPRIKCFDVTNMSLKFERCLDAEVIKLLMLSEDYKKLVILEQDRYVEFHSQQGFYHKIRIPRFGRDMVYNETNCDLYVSATGSEIYRFNLEAGQFLAPFASSTCPSLTKMDLNPKNYLLACGSSTGLVETWDPRSRHVAGSVSVTDGAVTSLKFRKDGLTMAVGSQYGQISLFDIRSPKPLLVKDHYNRLPIKSVAFHSNPDLVFSVDGKAAKMWERHSGKPFTAIESKSELNGMTPVPDTGLLFMPCESKKIQTYYLPSLGPAPRWCSFLDNLTEELEESSSNVVYDDYKFVTKNELEELGLGHLMGSDLLRAYMHGFFLDRRLYDKAKSLTNPFAFEDYRKKRIREKMEEATKSRVRPPSENLPKVNRDLARKLFEAKSEKLIGDNRFGAMFKNPDFQIDQESEDFRLLNPLVTQLDKKRQKQQQQQVKAEERRTVVEQEDERRADDSSSGDSSDDERELAMELKKQYRDMRKRKRPASPSPPPPSNSFALKREEKLKATVKEVQDPEARKKERTKRKTTLGEMLELRRTEDNGVVVTGSAIGAQEMTFQLRPRHDKNSWRELAKKQHLEERKKIRRPAGGIRGKNIYR